MKKNLAIFLIYSMYCVMQIESACSRSIARIQPFVSLGIMVGATGYGVFTGQKALEDYEKKFKKTLQKIKIIILECQIN